MSKYSDQLRDRIKRNQDSRGSSGGGFLDLSSIEDVQLFKPQKGRNYLYILPYIVATKNHPQGFEKGKPDYLLDIYVHKRIGLGNESVICPSRNFKQPCPICEEIERLKEDDPDSQAAEDLKPSRRVVYNVIDQKDQDKGVQLFLTNHYQFEKELLDASANSETGDGLIPFSDPDAGYVVKFRATEETYRNRKYFKFKDFDFEKTDEAFEDDVVEQTHSLDKYMILRTYEEIESLFFAGGGKPETEDDEDEENSEKKTSKKTPLLLKKKTKKEDDDEEQEEDSEEEDSDNEEDEKPKKKKSLDKKIKSSEKKEKSSKEECPHDHIFGKDCDDHKECKKCDIWDSCADENDSLRKKG